MMSNLFSRSHVRENATGSSWRQGSKFKSWIAMALIGGALIIGLGPSRESSGSQSDSARPIGNQLAGAASPYLREAASQPVHWLPWGEAAFRWAQQEDKPILLDIGAVWCHWCHVMDVESYDNPGIAALINRDYVAIKVDMDERPDIDRRYQQAVQAISGSGGWPLTVFLTPQGKFIFGGTYFPPEDRFGRLGLKTLLSNIAEAYKTRRTEVMATAGRISMELQRLTMEFTRKGEISDQFVRSIMNQMTQEFDAVNGGFRGNVKFPAGSAIELALARYAMDQNPRSLEIVTITLDAMAKGGIYDQLGGGFFRYSTDPQWRVPHFEKMNYDNAELLMSYLHAYQATGRALYRNIAEGIVTYLNGVLSDQANGGFYAHQDADMTRTDDGDYYTWTVQETRSALSPEEAEVLLRYYDITPLGEMKENPAKNVLFIATSPASIAIELSLPLARILLLLDQGKKHLLQARMKRKTPFVDKTIYTDRNAMLISAYLEAAQVLGNDQLKAFALKTLEFLLQHAYRSGRGMYHAYYDGHARLEGLLNDQVQMAKAVLDAFAVTGEQRYVQIAKDLVDYTTSQLWDPQDGGFFDRPQQGERFAALERPLKDVEDNPTASPNGIAALVLDRFAYLTNGDGYGRKALQTLQAFASSAKGEGHFVATYTLAVHYHIHPSAQVVIIGPKGDSQTQALWKVALTAYRPGKMVAVYDPTELNVNTLPPAVAGAVKVFGTKGEPRAYVCAGSTCAPPTGNPDEVMVLVQRYGLEKS